MTLRGKSSPNLILKPGLSKDGHRLFLSRMVMAIKQRGDSRIAVVMNPGVNKGQGLMSGHLFFHQPE
jgi:hypothetical protein